MRTLLFLLAVGGILYFLPLFISPQYEDEVRMESGHGDFNDKVEIIVGNITFYDTLTLIKRNKSYPKDLCTDSKLILTIRRNVYYSYPLIDGDTTTNIEVRSTVDTSSFKMDTVFGKCNVLLRELPIPIPTLTNQHMAMFSRFQLNVATSADLKETARKSLEQYIITVVKNEVREKAVHAGMDGYNNMGASKPPD